MPSFQTLDDFRARSVMPPEDIDALVRLSWTKTADALATDVTNETLVDRRRVYVPGELVSVLLTPSGVLVANDTNYATVNVYKRSAGGPRVLVASVTTQTSGTGSWSSGIAVAVPIVAAAVAANDQITAEVLKTGTGVVVPAFRLDVQPSPSFVEKKLDENTAKIYARLQKRYAVPFDSAAPAPEKAQQWLEALTTRDCYLRRGFAAGSQQDSEILERAKAAEQEMKEAADAKDGLFELPMREDTTGSSGVSIGAPLVYSETSPYVGFDVEICNGSREDGSGRGTSS